MRHSPRHRRTVAFILATLVATILSLPGGLASAATKTWVGSQAGRLWSNAANWSPSGVPTSTDDVVADATGNQNMTIDLSVDVASFSVNSGYTSAITVDPSASLVGYWKLDENTGTTAADSSGNGQTASFVNTPTWTTSAAPLNLPNPSALSFNGTNASTTVTSTAALQITGDLTVSFWVNRAADVAGFTRMVGKGYSSGRNYGVWIGAATANRIYFQQYSAAGGALINLTGTTVLAIGTWYHVTCTVSGNVVRIYVNGVLDAFGTRSGTPGTSAEALTFAYDGANNRFNGRLDDIRIYNRAISDVEISSLAAGNAPVATVPIRVRGDLTLAAASPASFTSTAATLQLDGRFNHTGTMTFSPNGGTLLLSAASAKTHAFGGSTLNQVIVNDGLMGYWPLDEDAGVTLADRSGYGQTGAFVNTPTWTTSSAPLSSSNRSALAFNGTNAYTTGTWTPGLDITGDLTISFWVNRAGTTSTWTRMVGKGKSLTDLNYAVWTGSPVNYKTYFQQYSSTGALMFDLTGSTVLAIGTWYHIVCTVTGTTARIYVNGVLDGTTSRGAALPGTSTEPVTLGYAPGFAFSYFNGSLDDVRIYNRSLPISEIASLAAGNVPATSIATHTFSDALTTSGDLTIASGAITNGANAITVGGSWLNFGGGSSLGAGAVTLDGTSGAGVLRSGQVHFNNLFLNGVGGTWTMADRLWVDNGLEVDNGTLATSSYNVSVGGASAFSGGTFTARTGNVTLTGAATISGGATVNAGGSSSFTLGSTLAIGSGTSGTFNANSATVNFTGAVTLQDGGAFNGNTGSGTFSAAPTLTSGTFTVGDAGSTGRWTFAESTTFSSGVTLAFPTDRGELSLSPTKTLTLNGPVTSNVGTASTLPKIDCNGCGAGQGITVAVGSTATLNVNGLEFDNSVATGVSVAAGATYTLFKRLKFLNNVGGAGSTHLLLTLGSAVLNAPGCYFDTTAAHNVTLYGTAASPAGARAIFENQSIATNGSGADASLDQDGDTSADNVGDNTSTAPYYGSVVEWVRTSTTDTAGAIVGFPAPAFDWNTFTFYGVYVAFKDTAGAGTADVLWRRNDDGSAAASYSVPQASGDIVGTPFFDTINEVTAGVDANGNGNATDTDVRVAYIGTTTGHIIKLVDTGSALVQPTSGPWSSDFTSASVATITSPLIEDGVNLYFGGTDGSAATKVFGVQIAGGANQKTLQKNVGSVSAVTTTPAWSVYSGSTYVFVGSTATSNQAYVYRVNMSAGAVSASYGGASSTVNDSVTLVNNRAYAVTDGGTLHVLDASNFGTGAFTNLTGFPYQSTAAQAIKAAPWVDYKKNYAYFGDDGGNLYVVTDTGANLTGYPFSLSPSIKVSSSPIYHGASGVIAVGADDGYLYFVDRHNASNVPQVFKRYFITSSGSVSTVSYDSNISAYLVSSSDGKLVFVSATDVGDPTPSTE